MGHTRRAPHRDRDLDRTHLPPTPQTSPPRPLDPHRIRNHHEPHRHPGGLNHCHSFLQQPPASVGEVEMRDQLTSKRRESAAWTSCSSTTHCRPEQGALIALASGPFVAGLSLAYSASEGAPRWRACFSRKHPELMDMEVLTSVPSMKSPPYESV